MFILVELKKAIRLLADLVQLQLQVRQRWFPVGIFPPGQLFGLIPINRDNPPLRVASYVSGHAKCHLRMIIIKYQTKWKQF